MTIALALLLCLGAAAMFIGVGRWIVRPIDRAARIRGGAVQFSISDFLCLFLAIQIPLSAIHVLVRGEEKRMFWLFTIVTWIVGPLVWYICGRALSKAGVTHGKRRILFLGLVLPVVYYGLIPFAILPAMALWAMVTRDVIMASNLQGLGWVWVALGVLLAACGLYTRHLVRQVEMELVTELAAYAGAAND
ncbi:MAG: hypothetical protein WD669_03730 [Pirellulales bacterium]